MGDVTDEAGVTGPRPGARLRRPTRAEVIRSEARRRWADFEAWAKRPMRMSAGTLAYWRERFDAAADLEVAWAEDDEARRARRIPEDSMVLVSRALVEALLTGRDWGAEEAEDAAREEGDDGR